MQLRSSAPPRQVRVKEDITLESGETLTRGSGADRRDVENQRQIEGDNPIGSHWDVVLNLLHMLGAVGPK